MAEDNSVEARLTHEQCKDINCPCQHETEHHYNG
jgi:hypothetical protein